VKTEPSFFVLKREHDHLEVEYAEPPRTEIRLLCSELVKLVGKTRPISLLGEAKNGTSNRYLRPGKLFSTMRWSSDALEEPHPLYQMVKTQDDVWIALDIVREFATV
jgi:hypothetical protein